MYCLDNYQGSNKPQTKHAERMILPGSSQNALLSQHSLQTKAVIELLHAQNDMAFVIVAPFSPFVCKLANVAVFGSCGSAKF